MNRREALVRMTNGFGAIGLAGLLHGESASLLPKKPHFAPKAKQVIFLFLNGGPSQVDIPTTIGMAVPGVEFRVAETGCLFAHGPNIMMGYWNNPEATRAVLSEDGWLNTGDQVKIDEKGFVRITGRLKEIIVMGNGEKVPPADMEMAIQLDPLFEQILVYGEAKPYLSAVAVLNDDEWGKVAAENKLDPNLNGNGRDKAEKFLVQRITKRIKDFPGYAQVRKVTVAPEKWTIDNGLMTPTLKLKRVAIFQKYAPAIEGMYKGHTL